MNRWLSAIAFIWIALAGCDSAPSLKCTSDKPIVVASFSVLADMIEQISGDTVHVEMIVPYNADPHIYQPKPQDVTKISRAHLVCINGAGFEGWFERLIDAAGPRCVVIASEGIQPRSILDANGQQVPDPHLWHDIRHGIHYVDNITRALQTVFPQYAEDYARRAHHYKQQLYALDKKIRKDFAELREKHPHLTFKTLTTHDAFWYYGDAYGVEFIAPVGISTEAEASAHTIAAMIQTIRHEDIRAVFVEHLSDRKLVDQIAHEAGVTVDGVLYADSLSDPQQDATAATYIDMIRGNTHAIIAGLLS